MRHPFCREFLSSDARENPRQMDGGRFKSRQNAERFIGQRRGAGLLGLTETSGRRDGELKTYWTEPLHYSAPMGIELFVSLRGAILTAGCISRTACELADAEFRSRMAAAM